LGKAKSDTHAEFINPVDTSFVEQETTVLDFFGCKGAFMLPYEFRAKEIDEHPQNENIAEPSSVEKEHQSEEAQDLEKKEDKKLENHQEAGQDIVQIVQPPYSPSMIDFDNKKILIRSDQTEFTKGKNIVTDNNAAPRMIKSKKLEIGQQKVSERKRKLAPKLNPTVKQLLDKYISRKANNVFSRLGGTKRLRSPSRPGGHDHWRGHSYDRHGYFPIKPTYWSCSPPRHSQFSSWRFTPWVPYPTRPARYLRPEWVPSRPMFRAKWHEKRVQLNKEARSHDATALHNAYGKNYKGDCKLVWVPVKHVEPKLVSMMAPIVLRKVLPKIIGHEALHSTSKTRKSMGTRLLLTIIRTSSILPKGFFLATSARGTSK
jgi:hypothetical protein